MGTISTLNEIANNKTGQSGPQGLIKKHGLNSAKSLRRSHFHPVVLNGWGDGHHSYIHAMAWFRDHLYVGVTRNALNGVRPYSRLEPLQIYPVKIPEVHWDLDWRAPIWRYNPRADQWEKVYVSPMTMGSRGFPVPRQWGYRNMLVFQGTSDPAPALYVVSWGSHMGPGPHVLRSADGIRFEEVGDEDLQKIGAKTLRGLVPFKGRIFTSPAARCGGKDKTTHDVPIILESADPANGGWQQVCEPFFGDTNNLSISDMAVCHGHLYAGTMNAHDGYQIWRTDADGEPPYRWERIITGGAYRGNLNEGAATLCEFNGQLYVGSGIYNLGYDRLHGVGPGMPELIRVDADGSWDLLVGEPRRTPDGLKTPLSGMGAGFNSPFAGYIWCMCEHLGHLYLGTADWSSWLLFSKENIWEDYFVKYLPSADKETVLNYFGGFDLWRSKDGANWESVTRNGFGNYYNVGVRTMVSTPEGLFVGVVNQFGDEVAKQRTAGWHYEMNKNGGVEVWRGKAGSKINRVLADDAGRKISSHDLALVNKAEDQNILAMMTEFYQQSGWCHAGFWTPTIMDPVTACENLMEELLAFFWSPPVIEEPHYPNAAQFEKWLQSRSTRPWEDVAAEKNKKRAESILDVGCGLGNTSRYLLKYFEADGITAISRYADALPVCRQRVPEVRFISCKSPKLRVPKNSYDKIICAEGLGAQKERTATLREIFRTLKPGGQMVCSDMLFAGSSRKNITEIESYHKILANMGFESIRIVDVTRQTIRQFRSRSLAFFQRQSVMKNMAGRECDFLEFLPGGSGEIPQYIFIHAKKKSSTDKNGVVREEK